MSEYDEHADLAPGKYGSESGAMSESLSHAAAQAVGVAPGDDREAPTTGVTVVDDVLAAVEALDGRPVEEHVAVFEQAHERLRRALDPGHG